MFAARAIARPDVAELERVEALVRERFAVAEDDLVLVTEEPGRLPGLPATMTTILFWSGRDRRHRVRIYKPAASVVAEDLPAGWLKQAFLDEGEGDCC